MGNRRWTYDIIKEEASKYSSRREFELGCDGAYQAALRKGIIDEVCSHMELKVTYWTKEMLQEISDKYNRRIDFQRKDSAAYNAAHRRGILDDICNYKNEKIKWTKELIQQEADKYTCRKTFRKDNYKAYCAAVNGKILDEVCSHMPKRTRWTLDLLKKEALKYEYRNDFKKGSSGAYQRDTRDGVIDDICKHMKVIGDRCRRCVYCIKDDKDIYIGLTYDFEGRNHFRSHIKELKDRGEYIQLTPYIDADRAAFYEKKLIKHFKNSDKLNCLNVRPGGGLGGWKNESLNVKIILP